MVEVVGQDNSVLKQITCRNCGAVLRYKQSEVKEYHGKDYSGGSDGMEWVDCPSCGDKAVIASW